MAVLGAVVGGPVAGPAVGDGAVAAAGVPAQAASNASETMAQPLQRRRHQISAKLPRLAALAGKGRGNHNSTNRPRSSPWLKPTQKSDSAKAKEGGALTSLRFSGRTLSRYRSFLGSLAEGGLPYPKCRATARTRGPDTRPPKAP